MTLKESKNTRDVIYRRPSNGSNIGLTLKESALKPPLKLSDILAFEGKGLELIIRMIKEKGLIYNVGRCFLFTYGRVCVCA